jgi:dienelactone hydrolase
MTKVDEHSTWLEQVKLKTAEGIKSFLIDMWLARHTPEKVLPILHKVIEAAKDEFADAVANGGGIYGVGYCFGAKYILVLAGEHADVATYGGSAPSDEENVVVKSQPLIRAGAIAHPTMVTKEDLEAVRSPIYIAAVQDDPMFSQEELLTPGQRAMEKNGVEHEVQVFSGVPHGFAVLGDYDDPKIVATQAEAYEKMLAWIQGH